MQYRRLGSTGLTVSTIGLGTWQYGGEWGRDFTQDEVDAIFDACRETGVNLVDTAECYGDHLSETFVGRAIARDRDRWVVSTKFGDRFIRPFEREQRRRPEDVVEQLEASLRALRTDRVELWLYHTWGNDSFFDEDVIAAVLRCRDRGKVRHVGNSVGPNTNVEQVDASPRMGIEAIQVVYNRLDRAAEDAVLPRCRALGLGVMARLPLASGYLSGKYDADATFSENEVRGRFHDDERRRRQLREAQTVKRHEVPEGVPMARWALAWCLRHEAVACAVAGCKSAVQARDNAAAAELDPGEHDGHPLATAAPMAV